MRTNCALKPAVRQILLAFMVAFLIGGSASATPSFTVPVDLSRLDLLQAQRAAVLPPEGYEVTFLLRPPQEQHFTLACWACSEAEFVQVGFTLLGADLVELRTRRPVDPAALIIRPGLGRVVALWDVSPGRDPVPPPPAPEEVARRQAAAGALLVRVREALGVGGFTGGPGIALRLRERADLTVWADGGSVVYTLSALGTPDLTETLEVTRTGEWWHVTVAPDHLAITREEFGGPANRTVFLRLGVDGWWEGTVETITFPGGHRDLHPLTQDQAREVLRGGLQELRRAREHFALGLGTDLSRYRLP